MKIEVKNIDYVWHAFMPDGVLRSAGVGEIVDLVEAGWTSIEPGHEIRWEARAGKFVVFEGEIKSKKMSKSDK